MTSLLKALNITFGILFSLSIASAGKVLVLVVLSGQSHKNVFSPIVTGLANKGHQVTVVSAWRPKQEEKNVREVVVLPEFDYFPNISTMRLRKEGMRVIMEQGVNHFINYCHQVYANSDFKNILKESFDVILIDGIGNECLYGVVHKLRSPFIIVSPVAAQNYITDNLGNRLPPSFVPDPMLPFVSPMSFFQRLGNFVMSGIMPTGVSLYMPAQEQVYREHLGLDYPTTTEIKRNASFLFINTHFSINGARPTLPDVVEIGGGQCKPGKPLPKDIEDFVSKGDNGFILFSLGSIVKPHELSDEIRNVFLNVFRKLKVQVIWKWNGDPMPGLPDNVKVLKWVPQQDMLAHPNIKLFMSHSGLLSIQETVYHGVPILAFPIFGDQNLNANIAKQLGFGEVIEILDVEEDTLENAITKILSTDKYKERVEELSTVFRDRNQAPADEAVYWTEYVMRYKGATHLRSASRELNFFQYHCLDVGGFLFGVLALVFWLLKFSVLRLVRKFYWKTDQNSRKKTN